LLHTNETHIWEKWFEIEPIEAIISEKAIAHPLKNQIQEGLIALEELRKQDPDNPKILELKLLLNSATTTPKINQDKYTPSPYGVHCLSNQIVSNGRATLFETIHELIDEDINVLQINTDGLVIAKKTGKDIEQKFEEKNKKTQVFGDKPGQLRIKCSGDSGFFLGANTWWLLENGDIKHESGTGRTPIELHEDPTIPTHISYQDKTKGAQLIDLLHLSDFRHFLNHQTGVKKKFRITAADRGSILTPMTITQTEKNRSWGITKKAFEVFRQSYKAHRTR
jgi:hypothetical protein